MIIVPVIIANTYQRSKCDEKHPDGSPAFMVDKMMVIFQIWGDFPVEKLRLKMPTRAAFKFGRRVHFPLRRKTLKPPIARLPAI